MQTEATQFLEAMRFRHACKEFDPSRQIPEDLFQSILEAGRLSPSSFGFEPWKFLVVQNPALREKIRAHAWGAQGQLPTAGYIVALLTRKPSCMQPDDPYICRTIMTETQNLPEDMQSQRRDKFRKFLDEDFCLTGNERAHFEWAARQCYIAMANMLTMAAFLRIDSCPMEGFNKNEVEELLAAEGLLNTAEFGLACMMAFGYRKKDPRPKTRRPLNDMVEWVK